MKYSEDGVIKEIESQHDVARLALKTLSCPLAYCVAGNQMTEAVACEELDACRRALGHRGSSVEELRELLHREVSKHTSGTTMAVALVPADLPQTGLSRWEGIDLVAWPITPYPDALLLRGGIYDAPLNERGAAVGLRMTADAEVGIPQRWARREGLDIAVRKNLAGVIAMADAWSVVVRWGDRTVTPLATDGAPTDGWRQRLIAAGVIEERILHEKDLRDGTASILAGWGRAYGLGVRDGVATDDDLHEFAHDLNESLRRLSAES